MKLLALSYSFSGNNEALAKCVANEFTADHIKVTETKSRTIGSIFGDLIFKKTPKVLPSPAILDQYDLVLLFGPIWVGQVATPLRAYMKHLKATQRKYAFISLCGGADNSSTKLIDDLKKRVGIEPVVLIDLQIADLLPTDPKPERKDISTYKINEDDLKKLTDTVVKKLKEKIQFDVEK